jgi:hypothetical protein
MPCRDYSSSLRFVVNTTLSIEGTFTKINVRAIPVVSFGSEKLERDMSIAVFHICCATARLASL